MSAFDWLAIGLLAAVPVCWAAAFKFRSTVAQHVALCLPALAFVATRLTPR